MMTKNTHCILYIFLFVGLVISACSNDNEEDLVKPDKNNPNPPATIQCDTTNITFSSTIKPILSQNCAISGCHIGNFPAAGLDYTKYKDVKSAAIDKKRNGTSVLLGAISHQSGFSQMPRNASKLPACNIKKIKIWIEAGAPNN